MCGIVGLIGPQEPEWLSGMNRAQRHRGPDANGEYRDPHTQVSLAMSRLSIVDLTDGHQPMIDEKRGHVVVFNGEIFNAPALRRKLGDEGYSFVTRNSDTECLLYLYDRYGSRMVEHLNGMFAFVIYDRGAGKLFGARDHCGIKPFYWYHSSERFSFASEIKSLLSLPFIPAEVDPQSVHHYLSFQFTPPPRTAFQHIHKLPAGHSFTFDLATRRLHVERYWRTPSASSHPLCPPPEDPARAVRHLLEQSVQRWLMSDVPIGCSLSGGLDSTAVVGLMASSGITPIQTWTLGFDDPDAAELDERDLALAVARRYGTRHSEIIVRSDSLLDDLQTMVSHLDEPYAGGLPSWFVFREMSRHVKVAMTGSGGDELFGNYGKWRIFSPFTPRLASLAFQRVRSHGWREWWRHPHGALYGALSLSGFGEKQKAEIWSPDVHACFRSSPSLLEDLWRESRALDPRDAIPAIDFQLQLPEEFLLMTDRFSMAWSIEARTPFLDRELVDFVLRLPPDIRTSARNLKILFRQAIEDLLPPELLQTRKRGFILPTGQWLRGRLRPMVEDLMNPTALRRQGLFSDEVWHGVILPHLKGQCDFGGLVWTLFMFQLWWRTFCEDRRLA